MGIYNINHQEIADLFDNLDVEASIEGDFTEEIFLNGAKEYLERLRKRGAYIPKK